MNVRHNIVEKEIIDLGGILQLRSIPQRCKKQKIQKVKR